MKVQRVYIDTSVVGGCHDEKFAPWSNVLMEDFRRGRFRPVVSDVIDAEIQDAPSEVRHTYFDLRILNTGLLKRRKKQNTSPTHT